MAKGLERPQPRLGSRAQDLAWQMSSRLLGLNLLGHEKGWMFMTRRFLQRGHLQKQDREAPVATQKGTFANTQHKLPAPQPEPSSMQTGNGSPGATALAPWQAKAKLSH